MPSTSSVTAPLNPYEILEVAETATSDEIRRSFRRLVLKAHPDKNPTRQEWSARKVKELFYAFDLIGEETRRRQYDERRLRMESGRRAGQRKSKHAGRNGRRQPAEMDLFFFRKDDPECLAMRILYMLLQNRGEEAFSLLVRTESAHGMDFLSRYLDNNDYMDCLFLLGEFLIKRKSYMEAERRLLSLYRHQRLSRFRRHYFTLAIEILKRLYLQMLPRILSPQATIRMVQRATSEFEWSPRELARLRGILSKARQALGAA